jgi:hypothetical protein
MYGSSRMVGKIVATPSYHNMLEVETAAQVGVCTDTLTCLSLKHISIDVLMSRENYPGLLVPKAIMSINC